MKPTRRPNRPHFSSGPCAKRPGWSTAALAGAAVGRAHLSTVGQAKIAEACRRMRAVLGIPESHRIAIVPGSDTGAVEMALWSLLGARGVDVLTWESFGARWTSDIVEHLGIADTRVFEAPYGEIPDLAQVDCDRDVVFTWNGTTSGVCVPDAAWIPAQRGGLTICDATSAIFAVDLPWDKLDVATWSWQKVLGGEAAHGTIALGPRAIERLETHTPPWPVPRLFRLAERGRLNEGVFAGRTINTPSLLCIEDAIDALKWAQAAGGLPALIARSRANLAVIADWVAANPWVAFLAARESIRSSTSICLRLSEPAFAALPAEEQRGFVQRLAALLEEEGVAYDIVAHRHAPPGLRIWGGATVERDDLAALLPWIEWAYARVRDQVSEDRGQRNGDRRPVGR